MFTNVIRAFAGSGQSGTRIEGTRAEPPGKFMSYMPYLASHDVIDATDLIARFGDDAGFEAAARADKSRDIGNHLHFCRWRQIERLIVLLSVERAIGTIH